MGIAIGVRVGSSAPRISSNWHVRRDCVDIGPVANAPAGLGCGAFGLVLYLSLNHTIPRVGATAAIAMLIVGQLLAGMIIDHFGAFGLATRALDTGRIAALVLLLAGAFLMVR